MTLNLQAILLARAEEQTCSLRWRGALDEDDPDPAPVPRLCARCKARTLWTGNMSGVCASCCSKYRRVCMRCHTERIHKRNRSGICGACFCRGER
jgi:hypothetical protein